ncbi:MAG: gliding motility-associated C-terminal domain-containing protein [Bacteroidales bacterium]
MTPDFDIGKYFKERIGHYAETPPAGVWDKITTQLPNAHTPKTGSTQNLRFYYYAAGLLVVGLIAFLFFLPQSQQHTEKKAVTTQVASQNRTVEKPTSLLSEKNKPTEIPSNSNPQKSKQGQSHLREAYPSVPNPLVQTTTMAHQEGKTIPVSTPSQQKYLEPAILAANQNTQPSTSQPNVTASTTEDNSPDDTLSAYTEISPTIDENNLSTEQILTACKGEELTLSAGEGSGHHWNTGQSGQTITYTPFEDTRLVVEYTDLKGRKVSSTFNITLLNCSVFVPKAFSPNDDGHNDFYRVKAEGINNFEMKIFSKWGELVFQTRDPEAGWDGKQKGNPAPAGVYIYQINYTDPNNQTRAIFGTLTLLR